jgi:uncharacterized protein YjdB
MKKYSILLLCVLLSACTYDRLQVQVINAPGKEFVLEASIDEPATKSGVGEFGSFYWTTGDQLALYTSENIFRTLTLKEGAGLSTATFTGVLNETEYPAGIAISPAQIASSYKDGKLEVVLPEKYEYNDNYAIGNPPMYALLGNDNGISFKHLCSMLRFTIDQVPAGATSVRLTSEGSKMAGSFAFELTELPSITKTDSESGNSIAIGFEALAYPKTMTFSFPIPTGEYDNLNIEILDADKKTLWSRKMKGSRSFSAGQLMVFDKISPFPRVIDLGLPNGTLWADRNVGANDPRGNGSLFAWGETTNKSHYTWANYVYSSNEYGTEMTKYNKNDLLVTLETPDDIATLAFGADWRMPTLEEMQELYDNCTLSKEQVFKPNGWQYDNYYIFTGPNGNTICFPEAGSSFDGHKYSGSGHYWTSTLYGSDNSKARDAYQLNLYSPTNTDIGRINRYWGTSVRPVYVPNSYFSISATSVTINKDETFDLDVSGITEGALTWKSEDESIAIVDNNGVVTGKSEGLTTIVVSSSDGKKKQSCVVRVVPDVSSQVSVSYIGGSLIIINSTIRSGSILNFTIRNNSSCGIRAERLTLINGVSGADWNYTVNATLGPGQSASYSLKVQSSGIQEPSCKFEYRYEGKTYTAGCSVPINY